MISSLPQSPSGSRARTKNASAFGAGTEDTGTLVRGALPGNIGASPFGVLESKPELPISRTMFLPALRSSPSTFRQGHGGLSLRRANSSSNVSTQRKNIEGTLPGAATSSRRGLLMCRVGAALVLFQLLLLCVLMPRPYPVHDLEEMKVDETSTVSIVNQLAARSRRSAQSETAPSRRERMWPSIAGLTTRREHTVIVHRVNAATHSRQQQTELSSFSQPASGNSVDDSTVTTAIQTIAAAATSERKRKEATILRSSPADAVSKFAAAVGAKEPFSTATATASKAAVVLAATATSKSFPPFIKPIVPFSGRAAHPPLIVGVIFYGRRDRVRILDCYLQRNMARNGGLLTYVVFVTATWKPEDVEFLDRLIAARGGEYRKVYPQHIDKGYTGHYAWMDPEIIYVKIDDDVVFIADDAIDHMLIAHNLNRYHLISANVLNHQPLELPHSQSGAHFTFEQTQPGDASSWRPVLRPVAVAEGAQVNLASAGAGANGGASRMMMQPVQFNDNGWDVWGDWRRAANVHYSFFSNHAAGRLDVYNFPANEQLWDFNKHFGYTRWRINMIMFKGSNIDVHVYNMSSTVDTYPGDDEDYITRILPKQLNRTSVAVSQALAVHFSFFMQRAGLENNTDLLHRYTKLAERTCGRLLPISS